MQGRFEGDRGSPCGWSPLWAGPAPADQLPQTSGRLHAETPGPVSPLGQGQGMGWDWNGPELDVLPAPLLRPFCP